MNELVKWLINVISVLFFLFFLQFALGIEFNEYPHQTVSIYGNRNVTILGDVLICPNWNYSDQKLNFVLFDYDSEDNACSDYTVNKWIDPQTNRVIFYLGYEIILSHIDNYEEKIEVEAVQKTRDFMLIRGKGITHFLINFV